MQTPKIREFDRLVAMVRHVPERFDWVDDIQIKLKGFSPEEVRYLAHKYNSRYRRPDATVNRYRTYFGIGNIWIVAMSEEYEIQYAFVRRGGQRAAAHSDDHHAQPFQ